MRSRNDSRGEFPGPVERRWIAAWPAGAVVGITNGIVREATYGKRVSERTAHQLSGVSAVLWFGVLFWSLDRRWPIRSNAQAVEIGTAWLLLTVAFEFGFGRLVAKQSWSELTHDYNLAKGRTWPLVLAWIALGPAAVRRLRAAAW